MGVGAGIGTGAEIGARASKTALRILCKSSSKYLGTLIVAGVLVTGDFVPEGPTD